MVTPPISLDTRRYTMSKLHELVGQYNDSLGGGVNLLPTASVMSPRTLKILGQPFGELHAEARWHEEPQFAPALDAIVSYTEELACFMFGGGYANVFPLSGTLALQAAIAAVVGPGETYVTLDVLQGGHNASANPRTNLAQSRKMVTYGLTGDFTAAEVDFDMLSYLLGGDAKPKAVVFASSLYTRNYPIATLRQVAARYDVPLIVDVSHPAGLITGGCFRNPLADGADIITFSTRKSLCGPYAGCIVAKTDHLAGALDQSVYPGRQCSNSMNAVAAIAACFEEVTCPQFAPRWITNAQTVAKSFSEAGLPLFMGGTDSHLLVVDVRPLGINGLEASRRLLHAGISVRPQFLPLIDTKPKQYSGIRLGTLLASINGWEPDDMTSIATHMLRAMSTTDEAVYAEIKAALNLELWANP